MSEAEAKALIGRLEASFHHSHKTAHGHDAPLTLLADYYAVTLITLVEYSPEAAEFVLRCATMRERL